MDAFVGLIFLIAGAISLIVLYFAMWLASFVLLIQPRWVGDQVVLRYWPERSVNAAALRNYRVAGFLGLSLSVAITIPVVLEWMGR